MDSTILYATTVSRRWLLGMALKSTAASYAATTMGELALDVSANGSAGASVAGTNPFAALAGGSGLARLMISPPPVFGAAFAGSIVGAATGSTIKLVKNLAEVDAGIGVTIDNARRAISGETFPRSFLIRETLAGVSHDTLVFAPETTPRTMKLGMNVAGLNYYSPNDQFLDYLKCAEVKTPPRTEDGNGMPLALKPGQYGGYEAAYMVPMPDGRSKPVKFRLITDGDMDFSVVCFPAGGYSGPGYGARSLRKEGADWTFTHDVAGAGQTITYFKVTALRTAPTYMALVRDDEAPLYRAGKVCRPGFVESLRGFEHLRWLNQSDANMAEPCFTTTNSITYASQAGINRCVPLEMQVRICIELGIGGWFHEHIKVTDAQAQARNVHYDRMRAAGLVVKKELSNEIWNGQFAQYAYGQGRAAELGYVPGNPPDHNSYEGAVWFNGYRTAQLAALDRGRGYKWCIGCQPANPSQASRIFQGFAAAGGQIGDLRIWTTANYMTGTSNRSDGISRKQFDAQLNWVATDNYAAMFDNVVNFSSGSASANEPLFAQAVATARAHGLDCECYEGTSAHLNSASGAGQVIGYPGYDAFLYRMIDQPEYYGAVTQNLEIAQKVGIRCCTAFDYNSLPANSQFGRFGLLHTPGYAALQAWIAAGGAAGSVNGFTPQTAGPKFTYISVTIKRSADQSSARSAYPRLLEVRVIGANGAPVPIGPWYGDQQHGSLALIDDGDPATFWEGNLSDDTSINPLPIFAPLSVASSIGEIGIRAEGIRAPGDFVVKGYTGPPPLDGSGGTVLVSVTGMAPSAWARAADYSVPEHIFAVG